jgi:signal transduction histidine kinase
MHGSPDARIRIATEHAPGRVAVVVQDFGGGIEPEHLHRIFDPFFTTKTKPRKGEHKGTGLGLAVSYGIIQEHSGKMQVESEVGVGTTFRLEFPIAPRVLADPARPPETEEAAAGEARSAVHV